MWADGSEVLVFLGSCVNLLESSAGSGGGRGSWTPAELEVSEGWIMQLEEEKTNKIILPGRNASPA